MTDISDLQFQYFFDPLCGWCYASAPALAGLAEAHGPQLRMMPSGLFASPRPVATMADHAWRNDQRIASLTGQRFTEDYHRHVLLAPAGVFDSTALTRALVALGELDAALEARFLHRAQIARYVDGENTSRPEVAARVAASVAHDAGIVLDVAALANRLREDDGLKAETDTRINETQKAMNALGTSGVPQLVVVANGRRHVICGQDLYSGSERLLECIATTTIAA